MSYTSLTRAGLRSKCEDELMDTSNRWWSDAIINQYLEDWQNDLQHEFEFVWATATVTTATNTVVLADLSPTLLRLDAVYYGTGTDAGYRLSGRTIEDVEILDAEWRNATPGSPRAVVQYDSRSIVIWPPQATTAHIEFEYPKDITWGEVDNVVCELPVWSQFSAKSYVAWQCYLQPGPVNDISKALKYQQQYTASKEIIRSRWHNYLPERYRRFKPAGCYEWDILFAPMASQSGRGLISFSNFQNFTPTGVIDGSNITFTLPITPTSLRLFMNGSLLLGSGNDYVLSGNTITMTFPPLIGSTLVAWTFTSI